jgi:hypothetical protein
VSAKLRDFVFGYIDPRAHACTSANICAMNSGSSALAFGMNESPLTDNVSVYADAP